MAKVTIVNTVGTAMLGQTFDLNLIALALEGAEYEPEQFPGLIYRIREPKAAFLIFKSGKVVCTGTKSAEMAQEAVNMAARNLDNIGVETEAHPKIEIVNIVASADLNAEFNLSQVAVSLGLDNVEYEPEQFPGMVYRIFDPKAVLLLFSTGKVICTGTRKLSDAERAVDYLRKELKDFDFL